MLFANLHRELVNSRTDLTLADRVTDMKLNTRLVLKIV